MRNAITRRFGEPLGLFALALATTAMWSSTALAAFERCTPTAVLVLATTSEKPPANSIGCNEGLQIKLSNGDSIWRCARTWDGTKTAAGRMMLVAADGTIRALPDTTTRAGFGEFSVWQIDLDGDGSQEQIISAWNGRNAAPARTNSWTSIVFRSNWRPLDGDNSSESRSMAGASDIHDWSLNNLIRDPADAQTCLVAISEFKSRGPTFGLVVDFYMLGATSLIPAPSTESRFRPWTNSLRAQRKSTFRRTPFAGDIRSWMGSNDTMSVRPN